MARINVEQSVLGDARYQLLADRLGCNKWEALGRMIPIWNYCQERERYYLTREEISALNPDVPGFENALIFSELAEENKNGIYIKGTKNRIEWLAAIRRRGRKYGKLGGKYGKLGGRPKNNPQKGGTDISPLGGLPENPPPAPAPAPALKDIKKPPIVPQIYEDIIEDLNDLLREAKKERRREGLPSGNYDPSSKAIRNFIDKLLAQGKKPEDFWNVHRNKLSEWKDDEKMRKFMRPSTLYAQCHFDEYLGQGPRRTYSFEEEEDAKKENP